MSELLAIVAAFAFVGLIFAGPFLLHKMELWAAARDNRRWEDR